MMNRDTTKLEIPTNSGEFEFQKLKRSIFEITGLNEIENLASNIMEEVNAGKLQLQKAQQVQGLLKLYKINTGHLPKSDLVESEWKQLHAFFTGINLEAKKRVSFPNNH